MIFPFIVATTVAIITLGKGDKPQYRYVDHELCREEGRDIKGLLEPDQLLYKVRCKNGKDCFPDDQYQMGWNKEAAKFGNFDLEDRICYVAAMRSITPGTCFGLKFIKPRLEDYKCNRRCTKKDRLRGTAFRIDQLSADECRLDGFKPVEPLPLPSDPNAVILYAERPRKIRDLPDLLCWETGFEIGELTDIYSLGKIVYKGVCKSKSVCNHVQLENSLGLYGCDSSGGSSSDNGYLKWSSVCLAAAQTGISEGQEFYIDYGLARKTIHVSGCTRNGVTSKGGPLNLNEYVFRVHKSLPNLPSPSPSQAPLPSPEPEFKSLQYEGESNACGRQFHKSQRRKRIVAGESAKQFQFPWIVSITRGPHCGASLLTSEYILTAAHCFDYADGNEKAKVTLTINRFDGVLDVEHQVNVHPERLYIHHKWRSNNDNDWSNDIALFKIMPIDIQGDKYIGKTNFVCLPQKEFAEGTACEVAGWGRTKWNSEFSNFLKFVKLPLVSKHETIISCASKKFVCTWMHGADACSGDSGGPLTCPSRYDASQHVLSGIVSHGWKCASEYPGVYTNVHNYIDWIERIVYYGKDDQAIVYPQ